MKLKNQAIIVTGGASGIGHQAGLALAAEGAGFINTPILGNDAPMKESLAKQHLHGKLIEPEQVASVVAFLFTDDASAINGSTIPVEDGFQVFKNS